MDDFEEHPADAFELGRVAAARLRRQNADLSNQLPNALETLFSDEDFQEAIVVAGVTSERQTLTPVASYQVTSRMLTRKQRHDIVSSQSPTRSPRYTEDEFKPSVDGKKSSPTLTAVQNTAHGSVAIALPNGSGQFGGTSLRAENLPSSSEHRHDVPSDGIYLEENVTHVMEVCTTDADAETEENADLAEPTSTNNDDQTNCLSCDAKFTMEVSDTESEQKKIIRELLWASLGLTKSYDRSQSTFPFCSNCSLKLKELMKICEKIAHLEAEFNDVRDGISEGIIARHVIMTEDATQTDSDDQNDLASFKDRILKKMQGNYKDITPGQKLLDNVTSIVNNGLEEDAGTEEFKCKTCQKSMSNQRELNLHNKNEHSRANEVKKSKKTSPHCRICDKKLKTKQALSQHMETVHAGGRSSSTESDRPFKCEYCDKAFRLKPNLTEHIRRHKGIRPFHCTLCSVKYSVMRHARVHCIKRHPDQDSSVIIKRVKHPNLNPTKDEDDKR